MSTTLSLRSPAIRLSRTSRLFTHRQISSSLVKLAEQQPAPRPKPTPRRRDDKLPVIPIVAIFCLGTLSFVFLVKSREGQGKGFKTPEKAPASKELWPRQTASDQTLSRR